MHTSSIKKPLHLVAAEVVLKQRWSVAILPALAIDNSHSLLPPTYFHGEQRACFPPMGLHAKSASSSAFLARPFLRPAIGSSHATAEGHNNGETLTGEGGSIPPTASSVSASASSASASGIAGGADTNNYGNAWFYHRSAALAAHGGVGAHRGGVPMQGNRPLLLPKPTMAAHNGRLFMEYEWANAGFF